MENSDLFWLVFGGVTFGGAVMALLIEWRWPTPKRDDDDDDLWWWSIK